MDMPVFIKTLTVSDMGCTLEAVLSTNPKDYEKYLRRIQILIDDILASRPRANNIALKIKWNGKCKLFVDGLRAPEFDHSMPTTQLSQFCLSKAKKLGWEFSVTPSNPIIYRKRVK